MGHAADNAEVGRRVDQYLHASGLTARVQSVVPLTGDASDRRYLRVLLSGGESVVLALHAGPVDIETLPFARVAHLLQRFPVAIPAILGHAGPDGILALEDLGDRTLQAHLEGADPSERLVRYREAVGIIDVLQRRGADLASDEYLPYQSAFDVEKLSWELDFFVRHFLEAHRGVTLTLPERQALEEEWQHIAVDLASEPRVLCHRDFHSRNLMVHKDRLYVIDFQDARLGPDTYDLASLLRDSYVEVSGQERETLISHFMALKGSLDVGTFRRRFDLMSLQRNLKALGTFGYQATARENVSYLQGVPRTLRYARTNLRAYTRFARLLELLAAHLAELR